MREVFRGTWVALVTPCNNGTLDEKALRRLVGHCMRGGVDGLVPCGCTGEAGMLDDAERRRVLEIVLEESGGKLPVVAGTGSCSTRTTLEQTREAARIGARAAMVITPYYVKPTQEGLYRHFRTVAEEGGLPVMLYNVPGRTGVSMSPETVARLAGIEEVVAIKEASGSPEQTSRIRSLCDLPVLSGDDALTLPLMALGAGGVVSVAANVVPDRVSQMVRGFAAGRTDEAREMHERLAPLVRALFMETNPTPVKAALALLAICREETRMPLLPAGEGTVRELVSVLTGLGLEPREALPA
jgi:4-hydroxy-tetrahydrodipicolinate synthase